MKNKEIDFNLTLLKAHLEGMEAYIEAYYKVLNKELPSINENTHPIMMDNRPYICPQCLRPHGLSGIFGRVEDKDIKVCDNCLKSYREL
jgi:hypothetical protein